MGKSIWQYLAITLFFIPLLFLSSTAYTTNDGTPTDITSGSIADGSITADSDTTFKVAILQDDFTSKMFFSTIAEQLGYQFIYQEHPTFDGVISSLMDGSSDFAANVAFSINRSKSFNISSPTNIFYTYFYSQSSSFDDAKAISVPKNSFLIGVINTLFPEMTIIQYSSLEEAVELIRSGKVDGVVDTMFNLEHYLSNGLRTEVLNDDIPIPPVGLASSFKVDKKTLEQMAVILQTNQVQEVFRDSVEQYQLHLRKKAIKEEALKLNIDLSQPIYMKLDQHEPIAYYSDGNWLGIAPEILREICSILDANCQITNTQGESWEDMYQQLKDGDIDLLVPMVASEERQQIFNLSDTYLINDVIALKRHGYRDEAYNDLSELIMERIAILKKEHFKEILNNALPNKKFIKYDTTQQKIQALINGEVDYVLVNEFDYHLAMKKSDNSLPLQIDTFFSQDIMTNDVFAFPKTDRGQKLTSLFNLGLDIVNTKPIIAKYDSTPDWMLILNAQKRSKMIIYLFFSIIILIISIFTYFLHRRSIIDELTKLRNRRALYAKYGSKGIQPNIRLIYLDVNNFKEINDTYGHKIGDKILITLANRINHFWKGDAYRIGGDEFILIGDYPKEQKIALVNKITDFSVKVGNDIVAIESSVGFYSSEIEACKIEHALHLADIEMYKMKEQYHNQKNAIERDKNKES